MPKKRTIGRDALTEIGDAHKRLVAVLNRPLTSPANPEDLDEAEFLLRTVLNRFGILPTVVVSAEFERLDELEEALDPLRGGGGVGSL